MKAWQMAAWVLFALVIFVYGFLEVIPRGFPPRKLGWDDLCPKSASPESPVQISGFQVEAMRDLGLIPRKGMTMPDPMRLMNLCRAKARLWVEWKSVDPP